MTVTGPPDTTSPSADSLALRQICDARLLAVLRGVSASDAVEVADALIAGGVRIIEVAFTTPDAPAAIARLRARGDERPVLIGAGTVLNAEDLAAAQHAGAAFAVSPGADAALLDAMASSPLLTLPGVLTPSDVMAARARGLRVLKLFPGSVGGPQHLRALHGPFPDVRLIPTGGVNAENARDWLAAGAPAVGAGSSLAPATLRSTEERDRVIAAARAFVAAVTPDRDDHDNHTGPVTQERDHAR